jgi:LytS/YehU family sensor histidine kinase
MTQLPSVLDGAAPRDCIAELADSELRVLQYQLHLHFLFNALAGITAVLRRAPQRAERMLAETVRFARLALETVGTAEVTLATELRLLEQYLALERSRLGERLVTRIRADAPVRRACVPPLVLQPLVENVVRHAYGDAASTIHVSVDARRDGTMLELRIRDDGQGPGDRAAGGGLSNTRSRLAALYGSDGELRLAAAPGGGTIVTVRLPFRITDVSAERARD